MTVIGLSGWSAADKTTLLVRLIRHLIVEGLRVPTIKHAHNNFDINSPGKDSRLHRQAGATEALVLSGRRMVLMRELRGALEPSFVASLSKMSPVDLLIVDGFKPHPHPKIKVQHAANGKPIIHPTDAAIARMMRALAIRIEDVPAHELVGA